MSITGPRSLTARAAFAFAVGWGATMLALVLLGCGITPQDRPDGLDASGPGDGAAGSGEAAAPEADPVSLPAAGGRPATGRRPATGLQPGLVAAYEAAARAAREAGHELVINSGFRDAATQQRMLEEEIAERGSEEEALRWVFPPERSMHVQGLAIDVGNGPAADWLDAHGARWGLCRTLDWEWWHFEWRDRWERDGRCPAPALEPEDAPGL